MSEALFELVTLIFFSFQFCKLGTNSKSLLVCTDGICQPSRIGRLFLLSQSTVLQMSCKTFSSMLHCFSLQSQVTSRQREALPNCRALHTPLPAAHPFPLSPFSILPSRSFQNMICVIQLGRWIFFTNHSCLFKRDYSLCRSCVQLRVKSCVSVLILALILLASMLGFFSPDILLSAFLHQRTTPLPSIFFCVSCSYK